MRRHPFLLAAAALLAGGFLLGAPAPARADCGGGYVACLVESGAAGTSEAFHETRCYAAYVGCITRLARSY